MNHDISPHAFGFSAMLFFNPMRLSSLLIIWVEQLLIYNVHTRRRYFKVEFYFVGRSVMVAHFKDVVHLKFSHYSVDGGSGDIL